MKNWVMIIALINVMMFHAVNYASPLPEKIQQCVACHGEKGNSLNPQWPNIAGQHPGYLIKQLNDFKIGKTRYSATMTPLATALTKEDIDNLVRYYVEQKVADNGRVPEKYLKRGEALYRGGDLRKHITACIACHGPRGRGNGEAGFPLLSGQHALYTIEQLQAFKNKKRHNDLNAIMADISARMALQDMEAVAYYIQGLH